MISFLPIWITSFSLLLLHATFQDNEMQWLRHQMVKEQIEERGVRSPELLFAMKNVKRHLFVPQHYWHMAYSDGPLPIGHGQTISQPFIVAYMTQLLTLRPTDKVLEIGTGSGYQAAILAELVDEVYTIELIEPLGRKAEKILNDLNYDNVKVKIGDGYVGWEEHAPFDAIIVTAAADSVPPPLIEQLKVGGRMVIPVGKSSKVQKLQLIQKKEKKLVTRNIIPVRFVPFVHNPSVD